MASSPSPSPFSNAWAMAQKAGVARPFVSPVPFPALQAQDPALAWQLAYVLAEATAFQQALGDWASAFPVTQPKEIKAALDGLRKGPRGPLWWRRVSKPVWDINLSNWRHALEGFRREAQQRHQQALGLTRAVEAFQQVLKAALGTSYPIDTREWAFQAALLVNSLEAIHDRLQLRESMEAGSMALAGKALAAVGLLQNRRGLSEEQAWEQARQQLNR